MNTYQKMNDGSGWILRVDDQTSFKEVKGNPDYERYLEDVTNGAEVTDFDWNTWNTLQAERNVEEIKQSKKKKHWEEYLDSLGEGCEFEGVLYKCDPESLQDWCQLRILIDEMPNSDVIQIRAMDNTMHNITVLKYKSDFTRAIGTYALNARMQYWAKVDAL